MKALLLVLVLDLVFQSHAEVIEVPIQKSSSCSKYHPDMGSYHPVGCDLHSSDILSFHTGVESLGSDPVKGANYSLNMGS